MNLKQFIHFPQTFLKLGVLITLAAIVIGESNIAMGDSTVAQPDGQSQSYLTVVADNSVTITNGFVKCDIGPLDDLSKSPIVRDITLHNGTNESLEIDRAHTASPSITATFGTDSSAKLPIQVAAGSDIKLHVTINPMPLNPGKVYRSLSIAGPGARDQVHISLIGVVPPLVAFSPSTIDFGRVKYGESHPILLTVHVDDKLKGVPIRLAGSQRNIRITQISGPGADSADTSAPAGSDPGARVYSLDIAKAPQLGDLSGVLAMTPDEPTAALSAALNGPLLPITGDVYGDVTAVPEDVDLGVAKSGQFAAGKVVFTGPGISAATLKVDADSTYFSTKFVDLASSPGGAANKVELDIAGTAALPIGGFHTSITVTTAKGLEYSLPLSVTVSPPPASH